MCKQQHNFAVNIIAWCGVFIGADCIDREADLLTTVVEMWKTRQTILLQCAGANAFISFMLKDGRLVQ